MNRRKLLISVSVALCACTLASCFAADSEYELHEWGVFSVPRGDAWAQRDMKMEWATFPEFFFKTWPTVKLPLSHPQAARKPVIFLHAEKPLSLELSIRFAEGRPLVWWPATSYPRGDVKITDKDRLTFSVALIDPDPENPGKLAAPALQKVENGHWVDQLRAVNSVMLFTQSAPYASHGLEIANRRYPVSEKFIYYDGIMKAPAAPKVVRTGDSIELGSDNEYDWLDVMAIERDGTKLRASKAWTDKVAAGAQKTRIELTDAVDIDKLKKEFSAKLAGAGLNADEAEALVKVWDEGIFKKDGLTLFYRIPQETYEKWLPLEATPAPKKIVRVGIVLHEHLEPELNARVDALIAKLSSEEFEIREAAQKALVQIGGAALPALEKHFDDKDPEVSKTCKKIYEALDALPAMEKAGTRD